MKDILHMDKVTKSFGKGRTEVQALKGIDLRVQAGSLSQSLVLQALVKVLS